MSKTEGSPGDKLTLTLNHDIPTSNSDYRFTAYWNGRDHVSMQMKYSQEEYTIVVPEGAPGSRAVVYVVYNEIKSNPVNFLYTSPSIYFKVVF